MKYLLRYMKPRQWLQMSLCVVLIVAQVWLDLRIPDYMALITREIQTGCPQTGKILQSGVYMLLCAAGSVMMAVATGFLTSNLAASFSRRLRHEIFHKVESFSKEEMDRFSTASLITRSTNDVVQIQNFTARGMRLIIQAPIMAGIALAKISGRFWQWTAVAGGAVLIVLCGVLIVTVFAHPRFRQMQTLTDELNRVTRENMTGMRVIRAYNAEAMQEAKFEKANRRLTDNTFRARAVVQIMSPMTRLVNNCLTICIYCIGAFLIAQASGAEQLSIFTDMVVFSTYAAKIIQVFMSLNMIFNMYPRAAASAARIFEVLETRAAIRDGEQSRGVEGMRGTVEFRDVSFSYPDSRDCTISRISFKASRGEMVGIIGSTASGKTTLMNLIPRFYDVKEGQVLVDGVDVRDYRLEALRDRISYVPQQAVLLTGTVRTNVAYGQNGRERPDDDAILRALSVSQASEFVCRMDGGLEAGISRGGTNVSGGQKQRLSIARAVCRDPEIYLFDDAFSALDYKTDRALRTALKENAGDSTVIIVASRIATIRDADQILVMDEGKIVGRGTHESLMKDCRVYQEIAHTQLSEEELA